MQKGEFTLKFWGKHACFINPFFKTEGKTYPIITPSAARGMFEAIYWKPEIHWEIKQIKILSPIQTYTIPQKILIRQMPNIVDIFNSFKNKKDINQFLNRNIRYQTIIHNPKYEITAQIVACDDEIEKHEQIMLRRIKKQLNYHQPYFGCREFPAYYEKSFGCNPIDINLEIKTFLFDIAFHKDYCKPIFWDAQIINGVLQVPNDLYSKMIWLR